MPESTSTHPKVTVWLNHIRSLAVDIGPRGPTREGERQGALYAQAQFERMGLQPVYETFSSARSIFYPHILGSGLILLSFLLFPMGGKITAILSTLLSIFVLVCELLELSFQNNPYRKILPKGKSQNVFSVIPPVGEHKRDIVLVGHLDSQRAAFIFSTRGWVKFYDRFTMVVFASIVLQIILYSLAIFFEVLWAWYASIPTAVCAILLAAMFIQAEASPFTAGANDNASAVGMVLALAEEFAAQPLEHTRVYVVCTGCEEVQHYGMSDFYKRHQKELKNPTALVFEMLGCASPAWLVKEGIIVPFKADERLVQMAEHLAAEHPEWEAHPAVISGGNTEMADALRCQIPAITITGVTRDGEWPYWHQVGDTFDKMNAGLMEKSWNLTRLMIDQLDKE